MTKYLVEIFWSDAKACYIAQAPDLPGCSASGETLAEAAREMENAMDAWLQTRAASGDSLPRVHATNESRITLSPFHLGNVQRCAKETGKSVRKLVNRAVGHCYPFPLYQRIQGLQGKTTVVDEKTGKRTRKLTLPGALPVHCSKLDQTSRTQICNELKSHNIPVDNLDGFFLCLEYLLGLYRARKNALEECKPAKVRENLETALKMAAALFDHLNELDRNSKNLLDEVGATRVLSRIDELGYWLIDARKLADQYPMAGALPDDTGNWLAINLAELVKKCLGQDPTTTREEFTEPTRRKHASTGLYDALLKIVLTLATGREVTNAHDRARKAVERWKIISQRTDRLEGEELFPVEALILAANKKRSQESPPTQD